MNTQIPPIHRFSMVYQPYVQRMSSVGYRKMLVIRRFIFFFLVLVSTYWAGKMILTILSPQGFTPLKWAIVCLFIVLFGWISFTFWMGLIGFIMLMRGKSSLNIQRVFDQNTSENLGLTKIAVVMPVYNEDCSQVFTGLRAMYESLRQTGQLEHFSFFILSDSNQPLVCSQEEIAWARLCQEVGGAGRIFYRRRKIRIHQKSGNIADFCRRWGSEYKYMIPLDADSFMGSQLMVDLVRVMESRPDIGIVQTAPKGINQKSLISRINQFTSHVYGPLLLAGFHFWQLDDSGFWGHNAIVRLEPFMKYCALPKLSGSLPFGGEILSHDFVEAALMRRAGWGVWLAYDLEGSYEGLPPDLLEELERDFRWCRGNIQHLRLIFMRGISFGHRLLFLNGNMFYFSAFLWFSMLVLMTIYAIINFFHQPDYFSAGGGLFPNWPTQYRHLSIELLGLTVVFLFLLKILSILWIVLSHRSHLFGGVTRLSLSVFLETIFSIFLAPIRMLFHSWFVVLSLFGGKFDWKNQARNHKRTSLKEAIRAHWLGSLIALIWAVIVFKVNQTLLLWLSVIVAPLFLAIPISIFMSSPEVGEFFKRRGIFSTPIETHPTREVVCFNGLKIFAFVVCFLWASWAQAIEIYLKNGDKITGDVKADDGVSILVQTKALGEIKIDKSFIDLPKTYPELPKQLQKPVVIIVPAVVWKKDLSLGFTQSGGDTQKQLWNFDTTLDRKTLFNEASMKLDSFYSSTDGKMDGKKFYGMLRYAYSFGNSLKWYNYYDIEGNQDYFADIYYRLNPSVGVGYWFSDTDDLKVKAELGLGYQYTNFRIETSSPDSSEPVLVPRFFIDKRLIGNLHLSEDLAFYPSLDDFNDYRFRSETDLINQITQQWSLKISYINDFDSIPPSGFKKDDYTWVTSLVYHF